MHVAVPHPIHLLKTAALLAALGTLQAQPSAPALEAMYGKLPLSFEANMGQTDPSVTFLARGSGYNIMLTRTEAVLVLGRRKALVNPEQRMSKDRTRRESASSLEQTAVRMRVVGADAAAPMRGGLLLPGKANYFMGKDPAGWRTNIATYRQVQQPGVYPGIDLVYYGNQRQLEYDFVVAPGADPRQIRIAYDGVDGIEVEPGGDLLLHTPLGDLRQHAPVIYQKIDGVVKSVAGAQVVTGRGEIAFEVRDYDTSRPLVIDPRLGYSTLLGGGSGDQAMAIALDSSGNAYVCGWTTSVVTFPVMPGAFQGSSRAQGDYDAFVAKMNPTGTALVYSTFLGGSDTQEAKAIAVDGAGNAYVGGMTISTDFPVTAGAYRQTTSDICCQDTFVTKLNPTGSALVYSTYLLGNNHDDISALAVDSAGNAYVTGYTHSGDFPTTDGAFQRINGGGTTDGPGDAFVTKLNTTGSALVYSTFIGGTGDEEGMSLAVDSAGNAYMAGYTMLLSSFPATAGAYRSSSSGGRDAVVVKLNPAGSALVYSAALGGTSDDVAWGVAVDTQGNAYVSGRSMSSNFPIVQGAYQSTHRGNNEIFVSKLNTAGSSLLYSTFIGGSADDIPYGMAVDSRGLAYLTGKTASSDFPTTADALKRTLSGLGDGFLCQLNDTGSSLLYSTYLGGNGDTDQGDRIVLDSSGAAYIAGVTNSTDFPTTPGPYQMSLRAPSDAYIVKITDFGGGVTPPPVRTIAVVSGNNQSATVGTALPNPLIVEVKDGSTAVAGVTVTFTATNASVSSASVVTDAGGRAQTFATMGSTVGAATITAATAGATSVTFTATALQGQPQPSSITVVSAANGATGAMAPGMIVSIYGQGFATSSQSAPSIPLPTRLGNVSVRIQDSRGNMLDAPLFYVSSTQINVLIPDATQGGSSTFSVTCSDGRVLTATVVIESVSPGIFTATGNGRGVAVGNALRVRPDGSQTAAALCRWDAGQAKWFGEPINMGTANDQIIVVLYGTGARLRTSLANVTARVGGQNAEVLYVGVQGDFVGLDQINLKLPRSLGQTPGDVTVALTIDGKTANAVTITVAAVPPPPTVSSISPTTGQAGQTISNFTINGANLAGGDVAWDVSTGLTLTGVTTTATSVRGTLAIAGNAPIGGRWVGIVTAGGESNRKEFVIQPPPTPTLTSISPTSGQAGQTYTTFTINGTNLAGGQVVWDNSAGLTLTGVTTTATSVRGTLAIASDAATGFRWLWVVTGVGESNHLSFNVLAPPKPSISSISPSSADPGQTISTFRVSGSNLSKVTSIEFTPATGITVTNVNATSSSVTATVAIASGASGSKQVSVVAPEGRSNTVTFTVNAVVDPSFVISNLRAGPSRHGSFGDDIPITVDFVDPQGALGPGRTVRLNFNIDNGGITGWMEGTLSVTGNTLTTTLSLYNLSFRSGLDIPIAISLEAPAGVRRSNTLVGLFHTP